MIVNKYFNQKILFAVLVGLAVIISACSSTPGVEEQVSLTLTAYFEALPTNTEVPPPSATPTAIPIPPTDTALPVPTEPPAATAEPEATQPPKESCLRLIEPENGAYIKLLENQNFRWEPHEGAVQYLLEIIPPPYHFTQIFHTEETELNRWMNTIPWGGEYSWQVTALNAEGQAICVSNPNTFTKSEFVPTATAKGEYPNYFRITPGPSPTPCW